MINDKTLKVLEYNQILNDIALKCDSAPGREAVRNIVPSTNIEEITKLLNLTKEADKILYELCINISFGFDKIDEMLELVHKGISLNCEQLLKVAKVLKVARVAKNNILSTPEKECLLLKDLSSSIFVSTDIVDKIETSILSESEVSSKASEKLASIRNSIANTNRKIKEKLTYYTTSASYASYLQDGLVTIRNNRYVIPVKTEYKGQVKGLIHDQSATGATTFIEPIAIVELNNELRSYQLQEQIEIENILRNLSYEIDANYYQIYETYNTLVFFDTIFAKASYSRSIKGIYPNLNDNGYINIINGRHPLLDKDKVVPVSIELGLKYNTLVVSGPNTGGKTVSLKLVGILTIMTMIGVFIPAQEDSTISIFSDILTVIGDDQSIENNLSTFSAHLKSIIKVTNEAQKNTLVLLDELGTGTDPVEGAALAIAVIDYLKSKDAKTIVTSHFKELKEYAYASKDVNIAGMDFDPYTFKPTYNLMMGQTASSNALEIAKLLGLNTDIVNHAKSLISEEDNNFNNIIKGAEINRREAMILKGEAEEKLKEANLKLKEYEDLIQVVEQKKEKLEQKLKMSAKEVLGDYLEEAEDLVEQLKEKVNKGNEEALFEARVLKKKLENIKVDSKEEMHYTKLDGEIKVNDAVFIKSLNQTGTVLSIASNKKECNVKCGVLTIPVKLKDLQKIKINNAPKNENKTNVKVAFKGDYSLNITNEINLIGKNIDEAILELETYLPNAKGKGYKEVRIVHGKGTGALRKGVQKYLKTNKLVEKYRNGEFGEGDFGVTIVTFK